MQMIHQGLLQYLGKEVYSQKSRQSLVPECSTQLSVENGEEKELGLVTEELSAVLRVRNLCLMQNNMEKLILGPKYQPFTNSSTFQELIRYAKIEFKLYDFFFEVIIIVKFNIRGRTVQYQASLMHEESPDHSESDQILNDERLLSLTAATLSECKEEVVAASYKLLMHLDSSLLARLIQLIASPAIPIKTKQGIVGFLKNCLEEISERQCDNFRNAHLLVDYLLSEMDSESKELLRQLFVHFLSRDQCFEYGQIFHQAFQEILKRIEKSPQGLQRFEVYTQLLEEMDNHIGYNETSSQLIHLIPKFVNELLKELDGLANQQRQKKIKEIDLRIKKVLRAIGGGIEKIYKQYYNERSGAIKTKDHLLLFSNANGSIVTHIPPCPLSQFEGSPPGSKCTLQSCEKLLQIKNASIQELMKHRESSYQFSQLMLTTILQCKNCVHNGLTQRLINNCLSVVQADIQELAYQLGTQKQKVRLFSSLMLLMTSPDSLLQKIKSDPQGFVSEADESFKCDKRFSHSRAIKPAVVAVLMRFTKYFSYKKRFSEDILILLNKTLYPDRQYPDPQQRINLYSQFPFYNLSQDRKLDSLLLLIGILAQKFVYQQDEQQQQEAGSDNIKVQLFKGFIHKNINALVSIEAPIATLRLIRILPYYYSPQNFEIVSRQFSRGRTFQLQGFKMVLQCLRSRTQQKRLINFVILNFEAILQSIKSFGDDWFSLLISEFYTPILQGNLYTISVLIKRIIKQFSTTNSIMQAQKCINIILEMIGREKSQQVNRKIQAGFFQIFQIAQTNANFFKQLQIKLGIISICLLKKNSNIRPQLAQLGLKTLQKLKSTIGQNKQILQFFQIYFTRAALSDERIEQFYTMFLQELNSKLPPNRFTKSTQKYEAVANYTQLMTQLITMKPEVCLRREGLMGLFYLMKQSTRLQKSCILSIILTYAYMCPEEFVDFLDENMICRAYFKNMLQLVSFKEPKFLKIFNLACMKLIKISDQTIVSENAFIQFVRNMKEVCMVKRHKLQDLGKMKEDRAISHSVKALLQFKIAMDTALTNPKGIIQQADEFEQFKKLYVSKKHLVNRILKYTQIMELSAIIQASGNQENELGKIDEEAES